MPNIKFNVRINSHSSIEKSLDNFYSNHVHQGNYGWRIRNYVSAVLLHVLLHVRSYQPQPHHPEDIMLTLLSQDITTHFLTHFTS